MGRFLAIAVVAAALSGAGARAEADEWRLWRAYADRFLAPDGRVVDPSADDSTTSEGQAYAMFLSLVANDRDAFDRALAWTRDNLAGGDLRARLPGWKWGRAGDGAWKLLDANSASDADLWIAYSLLEASRLWNRPELKDLGESVLARVVESEVADLPGLGAMLLPAPTGFRIGDGSWRLNPSYVPLQVVQAFATDGRPGPWEAIAAHTVRMIRQSAHGGFIADWVAYDSAKGFGPDPVSGPVGSYDAIRAYLWAGMLDDDAPYKAVLGHALRGMGRYWKKHGSVPKTVDSWRGKVGDGHGPVGFLAAVIPEALADGKAEELQRVRRNVESYRKGDLYGDPPAYYDQNLLLFADGFADQRFRFEPDGHLRTDWAGGKGDD